MNEEFYQLVGLIGFVIAGFILYWLEFVSETR